MFSSLAFTHKALNMKVMLRFWVRPTQKKEYPLQGVTVTLPQTQYKICKCSLNSTSAYMRGYGDARAPDLLGMMLAACLMRGTVLLTISA